MLYRHFNCRSYQINEPIFFSRPNTLCDVMRMRFTNQLKRLFTNTTPLRRTTNDATPQTGILVRFFGRFFCRSVRIASGALCSVHFPADTLLSARWKEARCWEEAVLLIRSELQHASTCFYRQIYVWTRVRCKRPIIFGRVTFSLIQFCWVAVVRCFALSQNRFN